jgi:membrane-bound serine protease (ClpP class)
VRKTIQAAAPSPSNTLESLIGVTGKARININGEGSVQVGGELWSARSEKSIPAGSKIRVVRREGFTLVVEKVG